MHKTPTPGALKIVKQLQEDLKEHYQEHKIKRDEQLLSKANLESDAGEEEKAKAIRDIKKAEHHNQCHRNFWFRQGTGISAQEIKPIQIPKSWKTMEKYVEDAKFGWIDPKKVDKDNDSMWRVITASEKSDSFF